MPVVDNLHEVTLNYTKDAAGNPKLAQPPKIKVRHGHKIRFKRGSIPPGNKIVVIFTEPNLFSNSIFDEGHGDITVAADLTHTTFYQCGLRAADGHVIPESLSGPKTGGQIDPAGGDIGN